MRIRIEIEDEGLKSSHEFESQNKGGEALREKIIGFLSASGIFEDKESEPHRLHLLVITAALGLSWTVWRVSSNLSFPIHGSQPRN